MTVAFPLPSVRPNAVDVDPARLSDAVAFALSSETPWPRDFTRPDGGYIGTGDAADKPPYDRALGPVVPRGGPAGLVLRRGRLITGWGDPSLPMMTFSIAKSFLALLTGVAVDRGLIRDLDRPVAADIGDAGDRFAGDHNSRVTWRHLLHQTSEWTGTLWSIPDSVDHHRQLGPGADNSRKGEPRDLRPPGTYWEYNDVRVNLLALALLHLFRRPLPAVLVEAVMRPIGASTTWTWRGYRTSVEPIGPCRIESVSGGAHWGGGLVISAADLALVGELVRREGSWGGRQVLSAGWIETMLAPCPIRPGYGALWWLNPGRGYYPAASEDAVFMVGAGGNLVMIDRTRDLIVVARWLDPARAQDVVAAMVAAVD